MKSRIFAVLALVGLTAMAIPAVASAHEVNGCQKPAWAYQHPGEWQYYQRHHEPQCVQNYRYDRRDRDRNSDGYRPGVFRNFF